MLSFFLHLDQYVGSLVAAYGLLTYAIVFLVLFAETGLVVMPFLPGDSLLFTIGAFSARGVLDPVILIPLLTAAAILGDATNYWVGARAGERLLSGSRYIKEAHIERTKQFFDRWGGRAIVFARFVPIVRTIAPFIAGVARMPYRRFSIFNAIGAVLWVPTFILTGYLFGGLPIIQHNFTLIILGVIFLSLIPPVLEMIRVHRQSNPGLDR